MHAFRRDVGVTAAYCVAIASLALAYAPQFAMAATTFAQRNDLITVVLQSSAPTYRVGQPVLVRVGLKNLTGQTYLLYDGPPWRMVNLVATDSKNEVLTGERDTTTYRTITPMVAVQPGQTHWLGFEGNENQWSDLEQHWSLKLGPGEYHIQAIPFAGGEVYQGLPARGAAPPAVGAFITGGKTINSNTLTIQITQ
jgi:hypothetical protein